MNTMDATLTSCLSSFFNNQESWLALDYIRAKDANDFHMRFVHDKMCLDLSVGKAAEWYVNNETGNPPKPHPSWVPDIDIVGYFQNRVVLVEVKTSATDEARDKANRQLMRARDSVHKFTGIPRDNISLHVHTSLEAGNKMNNYQPPEKWRLVGLTRVVIKGCTWYETAALPLEDLDPCDFTEGLCQVTTEADDYTEEFVRIDLEGGPRRIGHIHSIPVLGFLRKLTRDGPGWYDCYACGVYGKGNPEQHVCNSNCCINVYIGAQREARKFCEFGGRETLKSQCPQDCQLMYHNGNQVWEVCSYGGPAWSLPQEPFEYWFRPDDAHYRIMSDETKKLVDRTQAEIAKYYKDERQIEGSSVAEVTRWLQTQAIRKTIHNTVEEIGDYEFMQTGLYRVIKPEQNKNWVEEVYWDSHFSARSNAEELEKIRIRMTPDTILVSENHGHLPSQREIRESGRKADNLPEVIVIDYTTVMKHYVLMTASQAKVNKYRNTLEPFLDELITLGFSVKVVAFAVNLGDMNGLEAAIYNHLHDICPAIRSYQMLDSDRTIFEELIPHCSTTARPVFMSDMHYLADHEEAAVFKRDTEWCEEATRRYLSRANKPFGGCPPLLNMTLDELRDLVDTVDRNQKKLEEFYIERVIKRLDDSDLDLHPVSEHDPNVMMKHLESLEKDHVTDLRTTSPLPPMVDCMIDPPVGVEKIRTMMNLAISALWGMESDRGAEVDGKFLSTLNCPTSLGVLWMMTNNFFGSRSLMYKSKNFRACQPTYWTRDTEDACREIVDRGGLDALAFIDLHICRIRSTPGSDPTNEQEPAGYPRLMQKLQAKTHHNLKKTDHLEMENGYHRQHVENTEDFINWLAGEAQHSKTSMHTQYMNRLRESICDGTWDYPQESVIRELITTQYPDIERLYKVRAVQQSLAITDLYRAIHSLPDCTDSFSVKVVNDTLVVITKKWTDKSTAVASVHLFGFSLDNPPTWTHLREFSRRTHVTKFKLRVNTPDGPQDRHLYITTTGRRTVKVPCLENYNNIHTAINAAHLIASREENFGPDEQARMLAVHYCIMGSFGWKQAAPKAALAALRLSMADIYTLDAILKKIKDESFQCGFSCWLLHQVAKYMQKHVPVAGREADDWVEWKFLPGGHGIDYTANYPGRTMHTWFTQDMLEIGVESFMTTTDAFKDLPKYGTLGADLTSSATDLANSAMDRVIKHQDMIRSDERGCYYPFRVTNIDGIFSWLERFYDGPKGYFPTGQKMSARNNDLFAHMLAGVVAAPEMAARIIANDVRIIRDSKLLRSPIEQANSSVCKNPNGEGTIARAAFYFGMTAKGTRPQNALQVTRDSFAEHPEENVNKLHSFPKLEKFPGDRVIEVLSPRVTAVEDYNRAWIRNCGHRTNISARKDPVNITYQTEQRARYKKAVREVGNESIKLDLAIDADQYSPDMDRLCEMATMIAIARELERQGRPELARLIWLSTVLALTYEINVNLPAGGKLKTTSGPDRGKKEHKNLRRLMDLNTPTSERLRLMSDGMGNIQDPLGIPNGYDQQRNTEKQCIIFEYFYGLLKRAREGKYAIEILFFSDDTLATMVIEVLKDVAKNMRAAKTRAEFMKLIAILTKIYNLFCGHQPNLKKLFISYVYAEMIGVFSANGIVIPAEWKLMKNAIGSQYSSSSFFANSTESEGSSRAAHHEGLPLVNSLFCTFSRNYKLYSTYAYTNPESAYIHAEPSSSELLARYDIDDLKKQLMMPHDPKALMTMTLGAEMKAIFESSHFTLKQWELAAGMGYYSPAARCFPIPRLLELYDRLKARSTTDEAQHTMELVRRVYSATAAMDTRVDMEEMSSDHVPVRKSGQLPIAVRDTRKPKEDTVNKATLLREQLQPDFIPTTPDERAIVRIAGGPIFNNCSAQAEAALEAAMLGRAYSRTVESMDSIIAKLRRRPEIDISSLIEYIIWLREKVRLDPEKPADLEYMDKVYIETITDYLKSVPSLSTYISICNILKRDTSRQRRKYVPEVVFVYMMSRDEFTQRQKDDIWKAVQITVGPLKNATEISMDDLMAALGPPRPLTMLTDKQKFFMVQGKAYWDNPNRFPVVAALAVMGAERCTELNIPYRQSELDESALLKKAMKANAIYHNIKAQELMMLKRTKNPTLVAVPAVHGAEEKVKVSKLSEWQTIFWSNVVGNRSLGTKIDTGRLDMQSLVTSMTATYGAMERVCCLLWKFVSLGTYKRNQLPDKIRRIRHKSGSTLMELLSNLKDDDLKLICFHRNKTATGALIAMIAELLPDRSPRMIVHLATADRLVGIYQGEHTQSYLSFELENDKFGIKHWGPKDGTMRRIKRMPHGWIEINWNDWNINVTIYYPQYASMTSDSMFAIRDFLEYWGIVSRNKKKKYIVTNCSPLASVRSVSLPVMTHMPKNCYMIDVSHDTWKIVWASKAWTYPNVSIEYGQETHTVVEQWEKLDEDTIRSGSLLVDVDNRQVSITEIQAGVTDEGLYTFTENSSEVIRGRRDWHNVPLEPPHEFELTDPITQFITRPLTFEDATSKEETMELVGIVHSQLKNLSWFTSFHELFFPARRNAVSLGHAMEDLIEKVKDGKDLDTFMALCKHMGQSLFVDGEEKNRITVQLMMMRLSCRVTTLELWDKPTVAEVMYLMGCVLKTTEDMSRQSWALRTISNYWDTDLPRFFGSTQKGRVHKVMSTMKKIEKNIVVITPIQGEVYLRQGYNMLVMPENRAHAIVYAPIEGKTILQSLKLPGYFAKYCCVLANWRQERREAIDRDYDFRKELKLWVERRLPVNEPSNLIAYTRAVSAFKDFITESLVADPMRAVLVEEAVQTTNVLHVQKTLISAIPPDILSYPTEPKDMDDPSLEKMMDRLMCANYYAYRGKPEIWSFICKCVEQIDERRLWQNVIKPQFFVRAIMRHIEREGLSSYMMDSGMQSVDTDAALENLPKWIHRMCEDVEDAEKLARVHAVFPINFPVLPSWIEPRHVEGISMDVLTSCGDWDWRAIAVVLDLLESPPVRVVADITLVGQTEPQKFNAYTFALNPNPYRHYFHASTTQSEVMTDERLDIYSYEQFPELGTELVKPPQNQDPNRTRTETVMGLSDFAEGGMDLDDPSESALYTTSEWVEDNPLALWEEDIELIYDT